MKTLKYIEGNLLLNKEVEVIGHQANCQHTFGAGIARSIKEMYYEAFDADTRAFGQGLSKLGSLSIGYVKIPRHGTKISQIFNLYGQNFGTDHSKTLNRKTDYEALYSALERMANLLKSNNIDKKMFDFTREPVVGFPYLMGSALGGGSWDIVSRLIETAFDGYESDVLIVKLKQ
jgi:O-acetyl-ADP-ribose deacetylase (regulator of RNase III)